MSNLLKGAVNYLRRWEKTYGESIASGCGNDALFALQSSIADLEKIASSGDAPLTKEELLARREKPVWAIELAPYVDPDIPRKCGWGVLPSEDSFRQALAQDFSLGAFWLDDYGIKWIAFDTEQNFTRWPGENEMEA